MFCGHPFIQKKWNIQGWLVHLSSEWKDMLDKVEEGGGRQNIQRCFRGATQLQDSCHHLGWTLGYNQRSLYLDRVLCIVAAGRGANWQLTDKLASEELCWPAHYLSLLSRVHIKVNTRYKIFIYWILWIVLTGKMASEELFLPVSVLECKVQS